MDHDYERLLAEYRQTQAWLRGDKPRARGRSWRRLVRTYTPAVVRSHLPRGGSALSKLLPTVLGAMIVLTGTSLMMSLATSMVHAGTGVGFTPPWWFDSCMAVARWGVVSLATCHALAVLWGWALGEE
jgi:hypothetical protein